MKLRLMRIKMKLGIKRLLPGLALLLLLTLTSIPAYAGHWVISYNCTGQGTSRHLTVRHDGFGTFRGQLKLVWTNLPGGDPVWTYPETGQELTAFPTVTHPWHDRSGASDYSMIGTGTYSEYDHNETAASGFYPASGEATVYLQEPSTYRGGMAAPRSHCMIPALTSAIPSAATSGILARKGLSHLF